MVYLSITVPAHNEEKIILTNLAKFIRVLKNKDYEIIVVCNGCTDNTAKVVKKKYVNSKRVKICELEKPAKGAAILYGFNKSRGKIIGFVDADNPFGVKAIEKLVTEIKNKQTDCAIASKWYLGKRFSENPASFRRKVGSMGWNLLIRFLLGLNVYDSQGGTKFLSRKAFEAIDKNFVCVNFEFDIELLSKLKQRGFRIKEIYMPLKKSETTTFNILKVPTMFFNLMRLCWRMRLLKQYY